MPGIYQQTIDEVLKEVEAVQKEGIKSILLFGIPDSKDAEGSGAWHKDGIIQKQ